MGRRVQLVLYTGSLCHLCDRARDLVYPLLPPGTGLEEVEIDSDPGLRERYRERIPVLALMRDGELVTEKAWPFSPGQVKRLIREGG